MKVAEFNTRNSFFEGKDDRGTLRVVGSDPEKTMYIIPDYQEITGVTRLCTIAEFREKLDQTLNANGTLKAGWDAGQDMHVEIHHDESAPANEFTFHFSVAQVA